MADNNTSRPQRPGERSWRGAGAFRSSGGPPGEDPLAELARLIGQDDSFDQPAQPAQVRPPRAVDPRHPPVARDPAASSGGANWRKIAAAMPPYEPVDDAQEVPSHRELPEALRELSRRSSAMRDDRAMRGVDPGPRPDLAHFLKREQEERFPAPREHERFPASSEHEDFPASREHEDFPASREHEDFSASREHEDFPAPRQHEDFSDPRQDEHQYAQPRFEREEPTPDIHDEEQYESELEESADAPYYDEGDPMGPRDDYVYDDPPRSRGRNGLITAVTLISCAILGTAGAYGYRTYYAGSGINRVPPIITAETTPSKIVPSVDAQPSKSFQDRLGEQGQERVVSREEQPLDLPSPPMPPAPRIVLPAPVAPSQSPATTLPAPPPHGGQQTTSSVSPSSSSGLGAGVVAEPKRVHTVTIRPDGTDVDSAPISVRPPATAPSATGRQTAAPKSTPAPHAAAPLSLDPQANAAGFPPSAPERVATAPATVPASPSQNAASPAASGGYTVQLSSQRNEADAQSTFRALQAKFPDQLGSRSPLIRRVDLGDKGVYYRTLVGPFATSDEASRFCSSYKAAGGQCIVPRN